MSDIKFKVVKGTNPKAYEFTSGEFKNQRFNFDNVREITVDDEKLITVQVKPLGGALIGSFEKFRRDAVDVLSQIVQDHEKKGTPILPL